MTEKLPFVGMDANAFCEAMESLIGRGPSQNDADLVMFNESSSTLISALSVRGNTFTKVSHSAALPLIL